MKTQETINSGGQLETVEMENGNGSKLDANES